MNCSLVALKGERIICISHLGITPGMPWLHLPVLACVRKQAGLL